MDTTAQAIASYLRAIPGTTSATPCTLTIKGTRYPAARYTEHCTISPGCRAYDEGKREYDQEMIYVVGPLPACTRNGNVAFRLPGESSEWYVAGYYPAYSGRKPQAESDMKPKFAAYHPFGMNFLLAPWDSSDGLTIDHFTRVPYKRVNVTVS